MTREELTSLAALHGVEIFPSMAPRDAVLVAFELGAKIEREACAKLCDDEAQIRSEAGRSHPEDSESRGRCFAGARAAANCGSAIRARSENA